MEEIVVIKDELSTTTRLVRAERAKKCANTNAGSVEDKVELISNRQYGR